MAGFTNRGKYILFRAFFAAQDHPASFEVHLVTNTTPPTADHNTLSQLEEIADGNGYAQATGIAVAKNTTDWDTITEDDATDRAFARIKDLTLTASGGTIPASGGAARHAVLTTPDSGAANKLILAYWDLGADKTIASGNSLTLADLELRGDES